MNVKVARLRLAALVGIACASCAAFGEPLSSSSTGSMVVSWDIPTRNVDGTPLTDLQVFYVYVGNSPVTMLPIYATSAMHPFIVLPLHWPGDRYIAVTAVNANGVESEWTGILRAPRE
jgi:hypothetical protein